MGEHDMRAISLWRLASGPSM